MSIGPLPDRAPALIHQSICDALRAAAPDLDEAALVRTAEVADAAWRFATTAQAPPGLLPAVHAAEAVWARGHRAGFVAGHAAAAQQVAAAALRRAEPARWDMSAEHLQRANRLQAARLGPRTLRDYLERHRWQPVVGDRGARDTAPGEPAYQRDGQVVLVPAPGTRDYGHRMAEAVAAIEVVEDRSAAAILADLVPARGRDRLTHDGLRLIEWLHLQATALAAAGPDTRRAVSAAVANALAEHRPRMDASASPALAAGVGWTHGYPAGLAAGAAHAGEQLLSEFSQLPARLRTATIDGSAARLWVTVAVSRVTEGIARAGAGVSGQPPTAGSAPRPPALAKAFDTPEAAWRVTAAAAADPMHPARMRAPSSIRPAVRGPHQ